MVIYTLYFQERLMKARSFFSRLLTELAIILSILFFLFGCSRSEESQSLSFSPTFNDQVLGCEINFKQENNDWRFEQLLFFISKIETMTSAGDWQKPKLLTSKFQTADLALIGEKCGEEHNWQLKFDASFDLSKLQKLRFIIGIPFDVNHLNPLTQVSPLNLPAMFWGWQRGHKFLRLELFNEQDTWLYHLGSMGCKAASPLRAPLEPCLYDNKFTFEMDITHNLKKTNQSKVIVFDIAKLISGLTLTNESSCQSAPENKSCQLLTRNLQQSNKNSIFKEKN